MKLSLFLDKYYASLYHFKHYSQADFGYDATIVIVMMYDNASLNYIMHTSSKPVQTKFVIVFINMIKHDY